MRLASAVRFAASAVALGGVALFAVQAAAPPAHGQAGFVQDGKAGFVVADIQYALSNDAAETGACPNGMTQGMRGLAGAFGGQGGQQQGQAAQAPAAPSAQAAPAQSGQGQGQAGQGQGGGLQQLLARIGGPNGEEPCANPEAFGPDPNWRTVEAANIPAYGIDLDGQNSTANGRPAPGTCAHADFRGFNGERGVDNQFFRVVGCSNSFQSVGQSNTFAIEMLTGSWGILITLDGVNDIRNDNDVMVGFYANSDPIVLSPSRAPLPNATYAAQQDPRFRATTYGRIVNGVLTTDPVDVRFHWIVNSIRLERPLHDARVRMTLSADGVLEGYLGGYTPVEELYDFQYAFRNGTDANGAPAPRALRLISSIGQAGVLGHTCNGAYYALQTAADGHRDPATGRCTSISTQYRIRAIPAFVVDTQTGSVNDDLARRPTQGY